MSLSGLFTTQHWVTDHLLVSGWTAWAYGVVSVTLAALAAAVLPGMNPGGHNYSESGWVTAFDRAPPAHAGGSAIASHPVVRLSVRLTDGTVYVGDRAEFSVGPAPEGRELHLGGELPTAGRRQSGADRRVAANTSPRRSDQRHSGPVRSRYGASGVSQIRVAAGPVAAPQRRKTARPPTGVDMAGAA